MAAVTDEVLEDMLEAIASGETLSAFCSATRDDKGKKVDRPTRQALARRIARDTELAERYRTARDLGFEALAEEALAIVDEDPGCDDNGKTDSGAVRHQQLRADTRLRLLAKWCTSRYGDRLQLAGDAEQPLSGLSKEEMTKEVTALFARAMQRKMDEDEPQVLRRNGANGHE